MTDSTIDALDRLVPCTEVVAVVGGLIDAGLEIENIVAMTRSGTATLDVSGYIVDCTGVSRLVRAGRVSIVDGNIKVWAYGGDRDVPLSDPDCFNRVVIMLMQGAYERLSGLSSELFLSHKN